MIQYIASDVDGTLLHGHATELNPELFDIIRQLKEHGIHFIAASSQRPPVQKSPSSICPCEG